MEKKALSGIMLTLLLTSMLTLAFNIQSVSSENADFWYVYFNYEPELPYVREVVTFRASTYNYSTITVVSYEWNFSDGTPPVIESDATTYHVYTAKGVYNVTLVATDNKGQTRTASQVVTVTTEKDLVWFDYNTNSICWRANLTFFSTFRVDLDGNHSTAASGGKGGWSPEYGEYANLGVVVSWSWGEEYGYAFTIGEKKIEKSSAHIHKTYYGKETEWFYFWVPKTTPPTDWIVCLQGSDGVNPIPVTNAFWYSKDGGKTWKTYNPWTPTPDFSISASPTSLTIQQGDSDTSAITITSIDGFNQPVQLTVSGAPTGVTTTLNPEQVTPPPDGSTTSTLTVSVTTTATLGSYTLTVTGTSGTLTHSVDISLEITVTPINRHPNQSTVLNQFKSDGETGIGVGSTTDETTVVFKGKVSDPDGDQVKLQIELRRLDEYEGNFDESKGGFKKSGWVESGSEATVYAYGLVDGDYHWRARTVDEHGKASDWVDFGNNDISEADFTVIAVSKLRDTINHRLQQRIIYPPYLLDPNSFTSAVTTIWTTFTSWITQTHLIEKYDEFYWAGIDYDCLRFNALVKARDSLDRGDIVSAEKYLQKSYTYEKLSGMSFAVAAEVFLNNLDAAETLAQGIREGCETAVTFGLSVVNPTAAEVVDYIYLGVDYAVDRVVVGPEQATKDAIVRLMVKSIFDEVKFERLGGRTISDWVKNRVGKHLFPVLEELIRSEECKWALSKIIKEAASEIGETAAESLLQAILDAAKNIVNFEQASLESPGELRIYDSQGRVTGLLNGEVKHETKRSVYYNGTATIFYPTDSYTYEVAGTDEGTYELTVISVTEGEVATFTVTDIPTLTNVTHQYVIDWVALSQGEEGVTVKVDSDGDGVFELTFTSDSELTRDEFMRQVSPAEAFPMWIVGVAVATIAIATAAIAVFWRRRKQPSQFVS